MRFLPLDRVEVAMILLVLALSVPVMQDLAAQQASRLALTAAIWDDRSIFIDDYPLGLDQAEHNGRVVSDKAPGQPVAAVPAYGVYRLLGGEPARDLRVEANLGLWTTSIWSSAMPAAALAVLMRRIARSFEQARASASSTALAIGSLLLPFATLLFGHVLATFLAVAAWYQLTKGPVSSGRLIIAGMLAGGAVLTEYTMAIAAIALLVQALVTTGRRAGWMILGALPPALALMAYQWAALGSPFTVSYGRTTFGQQATEIGLDRTERTTLEVTWRVFFSDRGLVFATPIVVIGLLGMVMLVRKTEGAKRNALAVGLAIAIGVILVQCLWANATGGDSPGPRYATAAAAFVVPGVAYCWARWTTFCVGATAIGSLFMIAAAWTDPIVAPDVEGATGQWVRHLVSGRWGTTVFDPLLGSGLGKLLAMSLVGAALGWLIREVSRERAMDHATGTGASTSR